MGIDSMTGFDAKREAALDKLVQEQERLGLYDPAPQRQWVGLTEEEIGICMGFDKRLALHYQEFKLKERNHGT